MKEAESPRSLLGLPEEPPKDAEPISDKEARRISEAIGKPLPNTTEVAVIPPAALQSVEPQVLVMDRMSGALETAGVTQKKVAEVLKGALEATKHVIVGDKEYLEIDDHSIRLAAVREIKGLTILEDAQLDKDKPKEETSREEIMELFDELSPEEMSKMRKKVTLKRKIVQSVPPSVSPMVVDSESEET